MSYCQVWLNLAVISSCLAQFWCPIVKFDSILVSNRQVCLETFFSMTNAEFLSMLQDIVLKTSELLKDVLTDRHKTSLELLNYLCKLDLNYWIMYIICVAFSCSCHWASKDFLELWGRVRRSSSEKQWPSSEKQAVTFKWETNSDLQVRNKQ